MRDYWTSRYSLDEIRELAVGMWPDSGDLEVTLASDSFSSEKTKTPH